MERLTLQVRADIRTRTFTRIRPSLHTRSHARTHCTRTHPSAFRLLTALRRCHHRSRLEATRRSRSLAALSSLSHTHTHTHTSTIQFTPVNWLAFHRARCIHSITLAHSITQILKMNSVRNVSLHFSLLTLAHSDAEMYHSISVCSHSLTLMLKCITPFQFAHTRSL